MTLEDEIIDIARQYAQGEMPNGDMQAIAETIASKYQLTDDEQQREDIRQGRIDV